MRQYVRQITEHVQSWLATVPIIKLRASLFEESRLTLNYLVLAGTPKFALN